MEELKMLLENVKDSYYDFVMGMMCEEKNHPGRANMISNYIKENPNADTSEIIGWVLETLDGIDLESPESIVVDDEEEEKENKSET